jgi:hypothetical protein
MTNPFISNPSDCQIHPSGWVELPSGTKLTKLPIFDRDSELFARLGHGPAGKWLADQEMRLPTVAEYEQLHALALHIEPVTLPTGKMLVAAGVPKPWVDDGADTPAMACYRAENIRSLEWCQLHDTEVWARLAEAGWSVSPVANAGKHWCDGGVIFGWWRTGKPMIQTPSSFHRGEPTYTDYATTFHAALNAPESPPDTDRSPAASWHEGVDLKALSLGNRCLMWLGYQFGLKPREIPGPEHEPIILGYSKSCRRGGRFVGVREDGAPIWEGGTPLSLPTDDSDSPWCAALASATLEHALLPGEVPPHGLRVSVRELVEDARAAGTLRLQDWTPTPGSLAILGRAGHDPLKGGSGHVRCVVGVDAGRYLGLGGNEGDTITCAHHSLTAPELRAWVRR